MARRSRQLQDQSNLEADEVFPPYRFLLNTIIFILREINPIGIVRPTKRNLPLPPLLQLLVCLRFLVTGDTLTGRDSLNLSRSVAVRCIRDVADRIVEISRRHIKFPSGRGADEMKTAVNLD